MAGFSVNSADRCLAILELLAKERSGLSLTDIAGQIGLVASATHRLLGVLRDRGYVAQDERSGNYVATLRFAALSARVLAGTSVVEVCQPVLDKLAAACSELVRFSILERQGAGLALEHTLRSDQRASCPLAYDGHGQGVAIDSPRRRGGRDSDGSRLGRKSGRTQGRNVNRTGSGRPTASWRSPVWHSRRRSRGRHFGNFGGRPGRVVCEALRGWLPEHRRPFDAPQSPASSEFPARPESERARARAYLDARPAIARKCRKGAAIRT